MQQLPFKIEGSPVMPHTFNAVKEQVESTDEERAK
jgi:hypothetical protein